MKSAKSKRYKHLGKRVQNYHSKKIGYITDAILETKTCWTVTVQFFGDQHPSTWSTSGDLWEHNRLMEEWE